jgi:hypothetical protein
MLWERLGKSSGKEVIWVKFWAILFDRLGESFGEKCSNMIPENLGDRFGERLGGR